MTDPLTRHADRHVAALAARAAADPDRPRSHFGPPARWMNDPNGTIFWRGWYHLFYQHHPYGDRWGSMHWGHARSRDLATWEHLPIALAPDAADGEQHCFSGCIAPDADGVPRLFYTSVPFPGGDRRVGQWRASPLDDDLIAWRRDPAAAITVPPGCDSCDRDPFVFALGGRAVFAYGANRGDRAQVLLAGADDRQLARWSPLGVLFDAPVADVTFCECPNLLPLGDEWLLLLSTCRTVEWRRGRFADGRFAATALGRLDRGSAFYATSPWTDAAGRTVTSGWIRFPEQERGWSGCLSLPRLIEAAADGGIRQRLHPAVELLRRGEPGRWQGRLAGTQRLLATAGDAVDVELRADGPVRLLADGHELVWNGRWLRLGDAIHELPAGGVDLRVVVDRSVIEVFAGDGAAAITLVVFPRQRDGTVAIAADGAVVAATVWRLAPCIVGG